MAGQVRYVRRAFLIHLTCPWSLVMAWRPTIEWALHFLEGRIFLEPHSSPFPLQLCPFNTDPKDCVQLRIEHSPKRVVQHRFVWQNFMWWWKHFLCVLSSIVAISYKQLWHTWNVAGMPVKWIFKFYLIVVHLNVNVKSHTCYWLPYWTVQVWPLHTSLGQTFLEDEVRHRLSSLSTSSHFVSESLERDIWALRGKVDKEVPMWPGLQRNICGKKNQIFWTPKVRFFEFTNLYDI